MTFSFNNLLLLLLAVLSYGARWGALFVNFNLDEKCLLWKVAVQNYDPFINPRPVYAPASF